MNDRFSDFKNKIKNKKIEEVNPAIAEFFFNKDKKETLIEVPINKLKENPYQPRIEIKENELKELADSIKQKGLIQPIAVAKKDSNYYIIAGHRRVEAYKLLGKNKIKAIVIENQTSKDLAAKAIVENFQREDLNIIELAIALKRYKDEFNKSYEDIAKELGKSKSQIIKLAGILNLPREILDDIKNNKSTKDVEALNLINSIAKKLAVRMRTDDILKVQKSLYYGLLEHGREWLKGEFKRILRIEEQKIMEKNPIKIKKDKRRGVVFNVRIPELSDEKIKKIEKMILEILEE